MDIHVERNRLPKVRGKGTYLLVNNTNNTIRSVIHASNEGEALDQHESGTKVCHVYKNNGDYAQCFLMQSAKIKKANPHIKF